MQAAYVAMVEENEIRANLSHYERARIAMRAWQAGVYPTRRAALQGLFGAVSSSRRSKINSFIHVVEALDKVLRFPTAISEKPGLDLARVLQDEPGFADRVAAALTRHPPESAEEETAALAALVAEAGRRPALPPVAGKPAPVIAAPEPPARAVSGITARFDAAKNRIELTGPGVDAATFAALQNWLKSRG